MSEPSQLPAGSRLRQLVLGRKLGEPSDRKDRNCWGLRAGRCEHYKGSVGPWVSRCGRNARSVWTVAPSHGADGVFIACLVPVYAAPDGTPARELDDARGYAEIINPTVNGCLSIMNSAIRAGVKNIVIGSSTSSTNPIPPVSLKNEVDHWSHGAAPTRE